MAEIPKLVPEVEIPRPRSSGAAVVAVAALAMFTAVGASAFVVRVRMGAHAHACPHGMPPRVASARAHALELREAFMNAASRHDDETALEIYRSLSPAADPMGDLTAVREVIVNRQLAILEQELATGDCTALRAHVEWLKRVAPEEGIDVRANDCEQPRIRAVEVELVDAPAAPR